MYTSRDSSEDGLARQRNGEEAFDHRVDLLRDCELAEVVFRAHG